MSTVTHKNDAIEKGILVDFRLRVVHACKIREDIGAGVSRCGRTFLIGDFSYKPDKLFTDPPDNPAKPTETWQRCLECEMTPACDYPNHVQQRWHRWKTVIHRTLRIIKKCPVDIGAIHD